MKNDLKLNNGRLVNNYNSIIEQIRISADEADRDMNEIKLILSLKKFEC